MEPDKMGNFDYDSKQQSIDFQIDLINNQSSVLIISPNHDQFTKKLGDMCPCRVTSLFSQYSRTYG